VLLVLVFTVQESIPHWI